MRKHPNARALRSDEAIIPLADRRSGVVAARLTLVVPLAATVPTHHDLRWRIYAGRSGFIWDWNHLFTFIQRVGMSEDWAWVVFADLETGHFAQVCGEAPGGLVVELGTDDHYVGMCVPHRAHGYPQQDIGRGEFSFTASAEELVDVPTAHEVVRGWLGSHETPSDLDVRDGWRRTTQRR